MFSVTSSLIVTVEPTTVAVTHEESRKSPMSASYGMLPLERSNYETITPLVAIVIQNHKCSANNNQIKNK